MKSEHSLDMYRSIEEKLIDSITAKQSYEWHEERTQTSSESENDQEESQYELEWRMYGPDLEESIPLIDEEDIAILMEREAHFSGNFDIMLSYYEDEENRGVHPELSYNRVAALLQLQNSLGRDLAPLVLRGKDAERLQKSKKLYSDLSKLLASYEDKVGEQYTPVPSAIPPAIAIAESILSEDPLEILVEKYKHVFIGQSAILHVVVQSEDLYDRTAPGYGLAPLFAIMMLAEIQDESSIQLLFTHLFQYAEVREDIDDAILTALKKIGSKVKAKALSLILHRPWTQDSEKALHVLVEFLPDSDISHQAMQILMKGDISSLRLLHYVTLLLESISIKDKHQLADWYKTAKTGLASEISEEISRILATEGVTKCL